MSVIIVKNTTEYMAIAADDEQAEEIVTRWVHESQADVPEGFQLDLSGPREHNIWFLRHPSGDLMLVPAADFVKDFEEFDPAAAFVAALDEDVPNLPAEE